MLFLHQADGFLVLHNIILKSELIKAQQISCNAESVTLLQPVIYLQITFSGLRQPVIK